MPTHDDTPLTRADRARILAARRSRLFARDEIEKEPPPVTLFDPVEGPTPATLPARKPTNRGD